MNKKKSTIITDKISLSSKAVSAFSDKKAKTYAIEYLAGIRSNWQQTEKTIRGSILFLVFLVVAFVLLQASAIQEISIGPMKLKELSFIHKMIPALIAHCFYSLCNLALMMSTYRIVHKSILNRIYPSLVKEGVDKFLTPPYFSIFGDITFFPSKSRLYSPFNFLQGAFVAFVVFGSVIFEIYAFYSLFDLFGTADILTWISLVVSLILLVMSFLLVGAHSESQEQE